MRLNKSEILKTGVELLKYGVIGVSNTIITLVTFYLMNTGLGLSYGISNVAGYVLGVINSFIWNRAWVFKTHSTLRHDLTLFVVGFLLCLSLQLLVSWILLEGFGWKNLDDDVLPFLPMKHAGQNIVMVIAMVFYTIANYIFNRTVTFKQRESGLIDEEKK